MAHVSPSDVTAAQGAPAPAPRVTRADAALPLADRAWIFFETHRREVYIGAGVLLGLIVLLGAFLLWRNAQANEAQAKLAATMTILDEASTAQGPAARQAYERALRDEGPRAGLLSIAGDYGSTQAGNLARFYAASALFQLGRNDEAQRYFDAFDGDGYLGAAATAGEAAILENKNQHADAAAKYADAADEADSDLYTPGYLLSAARAHLAAGNAIAAEAALNRIRDDHAESAEAQDVAFYLGQLDAKRGAPTAAPAR